MLGEKVCRRGLVTHWSAGVERSRRPPPVNACGEFGGGGERRVLLGRAGGARTAGSEPAWGARLCVRSYYGSVFSVWQAGCSRCEQEWCEVYWREQEWCEDLLA